MRGGFKVFDADTHIKPSAESVKPYLPTSVLERIPDLEGHLTPIRIGMAGERYEAPYRHLFRFATSVGGWSRNKPRVLGEAGPREDAQREFQTFMGARLPTDGGGDWDPHVRLKDMDEATCISSSTPRAPGIPSPTSSGSSFARTTAT